MTYGSLPDTVEALEAEVLRMWADEDTFHRSLEAREGESEFVFYEGPPTANGRPGVHHVMARTIKDTIARYRAMTGRHVTRIAGWDTHGLPVEIEAEKMLGISGKPDIERLGIAEFNAVCRENLFTYKEDWERLSQRIGYWLDYDRPYVTCSPEYIESVWWALGEIDRKGLLYLGYKVLPYCPRCGTGLSSHEVAQGYADRTDPAITVRFPVAGDPDRYLLVWTTTPWTLVSNVAIAFGPDVAYVEVEDDGRRYILARSRVAALFGEGAEIRGEIKPAELENLVYDRPLHLTPSYPTTQGRPIRAQFVSDADGTGLVHIAPAFGADDFELGKQADLPVFRPVDDAGRFLPDVEEVGGMHVKDADPRLEELLDERGLLFSSEKVSHNYPHCWRCDTPLIYMARDSWYVRTTAVRERMLAENASVGWHPPEIGAGRMGEWLENNIDWAISRDRYWGTPLPIWLCADCETREVLGSYAELSDRVGGLPDTFDPHRPGIDAFTWNCRLEGCHGRMRRVPQVLDAWFDSGSMPFAQWHYPFENQERFASHFPADAIAEGVDQTRGWFYSLLALSTILFDQTAYRHVLVNDLILDRSGQKMSKSRGNVVDPWETLDAHGADTLRFYLLVSSNPWLPKRWDGDALNETNRKLFDTLRSSYRFFSLYAGLEGWSHRDSGAREPAERRLIDRWLLSRTDTVAAAAGEAFENYDLTGAARRISSFVQDDLSNWYVRATRDRFWATRPGSSDALSTEDAFATLHYALVTTARILAPLAPFLSDWMHRELTGGSVHLARYPDRFDARDAILEAGMEDVRRLATLGRAAREEAGIRVRQPLRELQAVLPGGRVLDESLIALLKTELNVKSVVFPRADDDIVRLSAKPDFGALGPRFGSSTPAVATAIGELGTEEVRRLRAEGRLELVVDGLVAEIGPADVAILEEASGDLVVQAEDGYLAGLMTALDEELLSEGRAREIVNRVQRLRRESEFAVSDRVRLGIEGPAQIERAADEHLDYIGAETLAVSITVGAGALAGFEDIHEVDIEHETVQIGLAVAREDTSAADVQTRRNGIDTKDRA
ncbi:MAG: isoleucine--tRNA ligase [Gemmatimonadota bacterium]